MTFKTGGDDIAEFVNTFEDNEYGCGADNLFKTDFSPPGLIVDDTLVLQTRVRVVKVGTAWHALLPCYLGAVMWQSASVL